ncbi:hypothetical protein [Methylovulum psychrotolerans]|jgi:predicted small lipoprotein YifL|uniref:Lipoprotein n=1 Tax=Methylovulum psychrotolerans TaxID=1704499 RepID=A0A1Z4BY63_9GAMM|nr:hypothetical protein [Methylovulum psychrotolerans]ASF46183.1 hypothetical protein CEK71_08860 [Methylovulum psychrotolerans]POZ53483.1 hypothetical protein AADEFJLK_00508 [Methylovulum psychrotolerans]
MNLILKILFLLAVFSIAGCDLIEDDDLPPLKKAVKGDHVENLTKARMVEQALEAGAVRQREAISQQNQ